MCVECPRPLLRTLYLSTQSSQQPYIVDIIISILQLKQMHGEVPAMSCTSWGKKWTCLHLPCGEGGSGVTANGSTSLCFIPEPQFCPSLELRKDADPGPHRFNQCIKDGSCPPPYPNPFSVQVRMLGLPPESQCQAQFST